MNIVILRCLVAIAESLFGFIPGIYSYLRSSGAAESMPNRLLRENSKEKCPKNPPTTHYSLRTITFAASNFPKMTTFLSYIFVYRPYSRIATKHLKITMFIYQH